MAVNGKHVLLYAHRMRPEEVDTLGIYGKVHIHSVGFSFSSVSASTPRVSDDAVRSNGSKRLQLAPFKMGTVESVPL